MQGSLGIVDWGIGGLGVYSRVKQLSDTPVLYFSDSGHSPFGQTPTKQLHVRLQKIFDHLASLGATRIAIACNAASAAYADTDEVKGIITSGVKILKEYGETNKKIGLLAGRSTVYSRIYPNQLGPRKFNLTQRVSQPLSAHVEAGRLDGEELHRDLKKIMAPLRNCDAVLLACTHYPAISDQIEQYVGENCKMLDPADEMANWIARNWRYSSSGEKDRILTTGNPEDLLKYGKLAFGVDLQDIEQAEL